VIIQIPTLSAFFGCTPLGLVGWAIAVGAAAAATGASTALATVVGQMAAREEAAPGPASGIPLASRDWNLPNPQPTRRSRPQPAALAAAAR